MSRAGESRCALVHFTPLKRSCRVHPRARGASLAPCTGATLVKDRVVDDGDLVTSGGVTSGIDLALWLVEREFGHDLAKRTATRMEYHRALPRFTGSQ